MNDRNPGRPPSPDSGLPSDPGWIPTGPRANVLRNSALVGQGTGLNETSGITWNLSSSDWSLAPANPATRLGGFAKWGGPTGADAARSDFNPGPESFFVSLLTGTTLRNTLSEIGLDDADPTVVTYQALVRVSGTVRFALAKSTDTGAVYDEALLSETADVQKSPWTLVNLRAQLSAAQGSGAKPMLLIGNAAASGAVRIQVLWQQAWWGREGDSAYSLAGGLANAGQRRYVSGVPVVGTYPWGVNSPSVRAADRFQLPLLDTNLDTGEAKGMGWKSPSSIPASSYDLQDGEAYYDDWQKAVLARMASGWFCLHQPERVLTNPASFPNWEPGREKNVVYTANGVKTLNLPTSLAEVAPGTVVRVFNLQAFQPGNAVAVTFGSGSSTTVSNGCMLEAVFYNDGGAGRWLLTQLNAAAAKKP